MKTYLLRALLWVVMSVACAVAEAQSLSLLKFNDYSIESVYPENFTTIRGKGRLTLTNNGPAFKMKNIRVQVFKKGQRFVKATLSDLNLVKGQQTLVLSGKSTICEGVSFWDVLSSIAFDAEQYTFDVSMHIITAEGHVIPYQKKGISAARLLSNKLGGK